MTATSRLCLVFSKPELQYLRQISMVDCKISKINEDNMYELKIIQFKKDCNIWEKQDGSLFINCDHKALTLWQPSWMACWMLFVLSEVIPKIILENRLHKFKPHLSNSKGKQILCYDLYIGSHL